MTDSFQSFFRLHDIEVKSRITDDFDATREVNTLRREVFLEIEIIIVPEFTFMTYKRISGRIFSGFDGSCRRSVQMKEFLGLFS